MGHNIQFCKVEQAEAIGLLLKIYTEPQKISQRPSPESFCQNQEKLIWNGFLLTPKDNQKATEKGKV